MSINELVPPDSRLVNRLKGVVRGLFPLLGTKINWVPIYCANCGKANGFVPEENMDFVCWLCDPCAERWGPELALAMIPDEIFWQKVHYEQLEKYGRVLSPLELQTVAESSCTPLSKLLRDKR
jgi:hypothetical protein